MMQQQTTAPAKTKVKRSWHAHAASAGFAGADAVPLLPLNPPDAQPIKEGIRFCNQSVEGVKIYRLCCVICYETHCSSIWDAETGSTWFKLLLAPG